jgi:hypothetical protein
MSREGGISSYHDDESPKILALVTVCPQSLLLDVDIRVDRTFRIVVFSYRVPLRDFALARMQA